jgi:uncharacterized membrane protein
VSLKDFLNFTLTKNGRAFWFVIIITVLMIFFVHMRSITYLLYVRLFLSIIFVLYLPGYSLVELVFASDKDVSKVEQIAYSFGLSVAVVILLCYLLNYSTWGIRLEPLVISISLFSITCTTLASIRKYKKQKDRLSIR